MSAVDKAPSGPGAPDLFKRRMPSRSFKRTGSITIKKSDIKRPPSAENSFIKNIQRPAAKWSNNNSIFGLELDFLEKIGLGEAVADEMSKAPTVPPPKIGRKAMTDKFRATVSSFRLL